ncbi:hypothetical protein KBZ10_25990 [Streptomyces sp. F63]|uniref:hypothetical protein n=1 Tax=Streptomyces sp. F63 TaxID=2824887 RepID=UPI001B38BDA8|nr:hypothetical protein [Streptomyces sp. F63]MBQ0987907.1 hypothetical protein [Streptomyces sp. F63]
MRGHTGRFGEFEPDGGAVGEFQLYVVGHRPIVPISARIRQPNTASGAGKKVS